MRIVKHALATVVVVIAVAGCQDDSPASGPTTSTPPTVASVVVQRAKCPATHPEPLVLFPETADEAELVGNLAGCTNKNGSSTYFKNEDSAAVWTIDRPVGVHWTTINLDLRVQAFRDAMKEFGLDGITLEPGQWATINDAPAAIHLTLNPKVQAAWQTFALLVDTARKKAEASVTRALSIGSPTRAAAVKCMSEGFKIGEQLAELGDAQHLEEFLGQGLGIYDGTKACAKSIKAAAGAERTPLITLEETAREAKSGAWRSATDTMLKVVKFARGMHFRIPG